MMKMETDCDMDFSVNRRQAVSLSKVQVRLENR